MKADYYRDYPAASKVCTGCGNTKSMQSFYRDKNTKDGKNYECRSCRYSKAWGKKESEFDVKERERMAFFDDMRKELGLSD